jgi:hypothetical protein
VPEFIQALSGVDMAIFGTLKDDAVLIRLLMDAVSSARYWQPPDDDEEFLGEAEVQDALRPIATAVASAGAASWWSSRRGATRRLASRPE